MNTKQEFYKKKSAEYLTMSQHARKDGNDKLADKLYKEYLNYENMLTTQPHQK